MFLGIPPFPNFYLIQFSRPACGSCLSFGSLFTYQHTLSSPNDLNLFLVRGLNPNSTLINTPTLQYSASDSFWLLSIEYLQSLKIWKLLTGLTKILDGQVFSSIQFCSQVTTIGVKSSRSVLVQLFPKAKFNQKCILNRGSTSNKIGACSKLLLNTGPDTDNLADFGSLPQELLSQVYALSNKVATLKRQWRFWSMFPP